MSVVVTNLIGGLGNQMFQYAAGRALALRNSAKLELDLSSFEAYKLRRYELDSLSIQASPIKIQSPLIARLKRWRRGLSRRLGYDKKSFNGIPTYAEPHFQYDSAFEKLKVPIHISGYWQSEMYFRDFADTIRREFTPKAPLDNANATIKLQIEAANAVSLHVRRGDYVDNPETNQVHGSCSLEYYHQAIDVIKQRVSNPILFVFSDDREWVRANMMLDLPTVFVAANAADQGHRDMQLMACCKHHIIANSSFSWWGAWLNPRTDKLVIAPKRWFQAGTRDTRDLLPSGWLVL